jgi:tRNA threonylcarbamoyladenosine biosynthesis protein TsaB
MMTLALDAATYVGTVAILHGTRVIAEGEAAMRGREVERLMPAVAAVLEAAAIEPAAIGRIVCGMGPGNFTSLRIAASIAKGLASGLRCRLYAASSLGLIVGGATELGPGRYLAVLDAMRNQMYVQPFILDARDCVSMLAPYERVDRGAVREALERFGATHVVGPGEVIAGLPGMHSAGGRGLLACSPHARGVARLSDGDVCIVDLATWEPDYGRLAEAQVKWEATHGRNLPTG